MKNIKVLKNNEELKLIEFIYKYQYLNVNDAKYFFKSKSYYRKRITNLVKNKILRRYKRNLVLGENGTKMLKIMGKTVNSLNYDKKYVNRLKYISHIASFYNECKLVEFTPSFMMKDKEKFTITSRRFIGKLLINEKPYLVYHIPKNSKKTYISSIMFDIQKEREYKNIIVLIDDINKIDVNDFCFGIYSVIIAEDSDKVLEQLKYINNIDWPQIINRLYGQKMFLSRYNFCEYENGSNKYLVTMKLCDTEKINKIKNFLLNNKDKSIEIVCDEETKNIIQKYLSGVIYNIVDLDEFTDKEIKYYE